VAPLAQERALTALLAELGALEGYDQSGNPIVAETMRCRDPEERVFYAGRWYEGLYLHAGESGRDQVELATFLAEVNRWVSFRDARGRRAFTLPVSACSDDAEVTALDRVSMVEWLDARSLRSSRLRWLVDYACRDDYGMRAADVSAWAGLFYFASRLSSPGSKHQPVVTWPEGNGRLVDHLARASAGRIQLSTAVCQVTPIPGGVEVVGLTEGGSETVAFHADQVVFAAPQMVARRVIAPWREQPPPHLAAFEYGAWMVANLHLHDRPGEMAGSFPLAWDNVLYQSPALGYVVADHQSGRDHGASVWTYYHPLADWAPAEARRHLLGADWHDWAEAVLADLSCAHHDIRERVHRLDIMRWGHAMVRPRPGFIWSGARRLAAQPFAGIHFAHSDLSGIALFEEALDHGVRAAEEILAARGLAVESLRG
jgi:hypothetical protein